MGPLYLAGQEYRPQMKRIVSSRAAGPAPRDLCQGRRLRRLLPRHDGTARPGAQRQRTYFFIVPGVGDCTKNGHVCRIFGPPAARFLGRKRVAPSYFLWSQSAFATAGVMTGLPPNRLPCRHIPYPLPRLSAFPLARFSANGILFGRYCQCQCPGHTGTPPRNCTLFSVM